MKPHLILSEGVGGTDLGLVRHEDDEAVSFARSLAKYR